jgi:ribosome biogenesis GTPase
MHSGVVVEYHREQCTVLLTESGAEVVAKPRFWETAQDQRRRDEQSKDGELVFAQQIAVGDQVEVAEIAPGHYVIDEVGERRTALARKGPKRFQYQQQLVAANADQLAVVVAKPRIALAFIDRCFLAAKLGGLTPLLVANKLDLDPKLPERPQVEVYCNLGYSVIVTSAIDGTGLDQLEAVVAGRSTVFCGLSGVGKSTLLARLTGAEIKIGAVRQTGTGKQTTDASRLYQLPGGGCAVDTPGVRLFGLAGLRLGHVKEHFSDIAALAVGCGFADCTHSHEPKCAVRQAVADGELLVERLASYHKLQPECEQRHWQRAKG